MLFELVETVKQKNPVAFLATQILLNIALTGIIILTLLSYISPHWFNSPLQQEVKGFASEYVIYSTKENPGISQKNVDFVINETDPNSYNIFDTDEENYYFKITPLLTENEHTKITHQVNGNELDIGYHTTYNNNHDVLELLVRETSLKIGTKNIPLNFNIVAESENTIDIDLKRHKVDNFQAVFNNKTNSISMSEKSIPGNLNVKVEKGSTHFNLPENATYAMTYEVADHAQLFVNNTELIGTGKHTN